MEDYRIEIMVLVVRTFRNGPCLLAGDVSPTDFHTEGGPQRGYYSLLGGPPTVLGSLRSKWYQTLVVIEFDITFNFKVTWLNITQSYINLLVIPDSVDERRHGSLRSVHNVDILVWHGKSGLN